MALIIADTIMAYLPTWLQSHVCWLANFKGFCLNGVFIGMYGESLNQCILLVLGCIKVLLSWCLSGFPAIFEYLLIVEVIRAKVNVKIL